MKKEMKRVAIKYPGKNYAVNTLKIPERGKIIYDLITIIDLETNKPSFTTQKLYKITLDTRNSEPELLTHLVKNLPGELVSAIKNGILNEYNGGVYW